MDSGRYKEDATGFPSKIRQRGLFDDGVWKCDCNPRKPAKYLPVLKKSPNQGRYFYTCSEPIEPKEGRCGFFLWADDAKKREASAVLSKSRTEPHDSLAEALRTHKAALTAQVEEEAEKLRHRTRRHSGRQQGQSITSATRGAVDTSASRPLFSTTPPVKKEARDTPENELYEWSSSGDEINHRQAKFHDAKEVFSAEKPRKSKGADHPHIIYEDDTDSDDCTSNASYSPKKANKTQAGMSPGKRRRSRNEYEKNLDGLSYRNQDGYGPQPDRGGSPSPMNRRSAPLKASVLPDEETTFKRPNRQILKPSGPQSPNETPKDQIRFHDALNHQFQLTPSASAAQMMRNVVLDSGGSGKGASPSFGQTPNSGGNSLLMQLTTDVIAVLDEHHVKLPREAESKLLSVCGRYVRIAQGIERGRDISRQAIYDRETEILRLRNQIAAIEAELDTAKRARRVSSDNHNGGKNGNGGNGDNGGGAVDAGRANGNSGARVSFGPDTTIGGKADAAKKGGLRETCRQVSISDMFRQQSQKVKAPDEDEYDQLSDATPPSSDDEDRK